MRPYASADTEEDREFYRWYGRWRPLTPRGVARLMRGSNVRWWIIGGWAIDAFTRAPREHEDIDVSFFRSDLPALLDHLAPRYCVWSNLSGTLKPLRKPDDLLDGASPACVRRDEHTPWVVDLAMNRTTATPGYRFATTRIRLSFDEATFEADGIRYLRPES